MLGMMTLIHILHLHSNSQFAVRHFAHTKLPIKSQSANKNHHCRAPNALWPHFKCILIVCVFHSFSSLSFSYCLSFHQVVFASLCSLQEGKMQISHVLIRITLHRTTKQEMNVIRILISTAMHLHFVLRTIEIAGAKYKHSSLL